MEKLIFRICSLAIIALALGVSADAQQNLPVGQRTETTDVNQGLAPDVIDTLRADTLRELPYDQMKKSLRNDDAFERDPVTDRFPLDYEHIREDDAVYVQKIWRDIDAREKINMPFIHKSTDDVNMRFISVVLKAIQDGPDNGGATAFSAIDDRFTTPLTVSEVNGMLAGDAIRVPIYNAEGEIESYKEEFPEVNLDSFYRFRIKEEVIFDKESSRLVWRILGIAPLKHVITSTGQDMGETELFWVYYPDMRPIFAKYEVYSGKNYGAQMSWEELFESRMFHGQIVKSTLENPFDQYIRNQPGFKDKPLLQLHQGHWINDEIFNYEQNLWSY